MLLPVPLLPQKVGNDITVGQVQDAGGIVVLVPGALLLILEMSCI